ncbi:hypothetical protein [Burkholderia ubonensis]|uniref:hypothetical protein n=1 Tax=Burkholderia ubonensis TaxID=101571 RepID=UPI000A55426D|nr:hypothetical protein [Burkholderia ubonensis]
MSSGNRLCAALGAVNWAGNVAEFSANTPAVEQFEAAALRLAIWSRQFENIEGKSNPAICFVREMQVAGHMAATASALGCYKLAASGLRTIVETALYYSYFRTHPVELATLLRDDKWYVSKQDILDYHAQHTSGFGELQKKWPLNSILNPWYSKISAVVHGQVPGVWHSQKGISGIKSNDALLGEVVNELNVCIQIVDRLFFLTVGRELWQNFSQSAKRSLIHGLPGDFKAVFGLDSA